MSKEADTMTSTGNEPADVLINTIYLSPVISVEAARLMEAAVQAALTAERRAAVKRLAHRIAMLTRYEKRHGIYNEPFLLASDVTGILASEAEVPA